MSSEEVVAKVHEDAKKILLNDDAAAPKVRRFPQSVRGMARTCDFQRPTQRLACMQVNSEAQSSSASTAGQPVPGARSRVAEPICT
eukprot:2993156-Rhodomonas_salina.1